MAGQIALRVVALVRVSPAPLEPTGRQLVGGERAGARGETENNKQSSQVKQSSRLSTVLPAGDDDSFLSVPAGVFRHDESLGADVLW